MPLSLVPAETKPQPGQPGSGAADYRQLLHELIEMGADLARMVHQQAVAAPQTAAEATIPFDRIARAVRRTVLLVRKLDEPVPAAPTSHRTSARRLIIRAVEDVIQRTAAEAEAEALHEEFLDRLDGPDLDEDIEQRPVAEIIADICRDLGLAAPPGSHPWKRRTPEDIATLCARANARPEARPDQTLGGDPADATTAHAKPPPRFREQ